MLDEQSRTSQLMADCKDGVCELPPRASHVSKLASLPLVNDDLTPSTDPITTPLILLYFSASWCPPCQQFSPILSKFIKQHVGDVTCIYVSADRNQYDMQDYISGKGWKSVSWDTSKERDGLFSEYGVYSIPTLLVMDAKSGKVITTWGKSAIMKNSKGCVSEWKAGRAGVSWLQLFKFW